MKNRGILLFMISILFLVASCTDLSIKRCKSPSSFGWAPPSTATCITNIAVDKVDYSICNKIEEFRYEEHTGNITDDHIKRCYAEVSARIVDISICDKIQSKEEKKECFDRYSNTYIHISLCKESTTQEERDKCFNELGLKNFEELGIKEQSISVCNKFDDQKTKDYCFSEIATRYEDGSTCDLINDKEEKDKCYELVGRISNDVSVCDKIQDQDDKNFCYLDVGVDKLDISICNKITNINLKRNKNLTKLCIDGISEKIDIQNFKERKGISNCEDYESLTETYQCYTDAAIAQEDPEICQFIDSHPTQNECYMKIAMIKRNVSICDKMTPLAREDCYKSLT